MFKKQCSNLPAAIDTGFHKRSLLILVLGFRICTYCKWNAKSLQDNNDNKHTNTMMW